MTMHEESTPTGRVAGHPAMSCPNCGHGLSAFVEPEPDRGERIAAGVAERLASWWFPSLLILMIAAWLALNAIWRPIEPYPTIVIASLAAALSTIAACQGPLILLSQRRAAMRDRARDRETYLVAYRSEADLHDLRQKVDELMEMTRSLRSGRP